MTAIVVLFSSFLPFPTYTFYSGPSAQVPFVVVAVPSGRTLVL